MGTKDGWMKAITLTQPWASLVACGAKQLETRTWQPYGDWKDWKEGDMLAIHAGKGLAGMKKVDYVELCAREPYRTALSIAAQQGLLPRVPKESLRAMSLPLGAVVAIARLGGVITSEEALAAGLSYEEKAFGNYAPGRWVWKLEDVHPIVPVAAKGMQRQWLWDRTGVTLEYLARGVAYPAKAQEMAEAQMYPCKGDPRGVHKWMPGFEGFEWCPKCRCSRRVGALELVRIA